MTVFETISRTNIDEFAEWLNELGAYNDFPWMKWWDNNYCSKCESVFAYVEEFNEECECAWCELNNGKCKFFPDIEEAPWGKQIIRLWLESEVK